MAQCEFNVELKDRPDVDFALERFEKLWQEGIALTDIFVSTVRQKTWLSESITPLEPRPKDWKPAYPGEKWVGRKAGSYKWYEIQDNIAYYKEFLKEKIVVAAMRQVFFAFLDTGNTHGNDKTTIIKSIERISLLCILNSKLSMFYIKRVCSKCSGDTFEFKQQYLYQIPISKKYIEYAEKLKNIYYIIENMLACDPAADITAQERTIDELVYDLYGLSTHERDIIENDIRQRG